MKIGVSGLAVGNRAGLGRLARICIIALACADPANEIHVYLRRRADLELLEQECSNSSADSLEQLRLHSPPFGGLNRLILEELLLPRALGSLGLDAYLGLDFTLPPRQLAPLEAVVLPDLLPFTRPESVSWRAKWLYRRGIRRSVSRGACMLCISGATRDSLLEHYPDVRSSKVVVPALSPKLLTRARRMRDATRPVQVRGSHHAFAARSGYLLSVGIAGPRKNTDLLVRTYRELVLGGHYGRPLVLVGGDGRYHQAAGREALAVETAGAPLNRHDPSPGVYDVGQVTDYELSDLYSGADLLVSFSAEEGFGYPVLEALAHGTPAVVTAGSPMQEIAAGGIAATGLGPEERLNSLVAAIGALPLLRRETAKLELERFTIARLGEDLLAALGGGERSDEMVQ